MTNELSNIDKDAGNGISSEAKELVRHLERMYTTSPEKYRTLSPTTTKIDPKNEGVSHQTIERIRKGGTKNPQTETIDLLNQAISQASRPEYGSRDPIEMDEIAQKNRAFVDKFANAPAEFDNYAENVCILSADLVGSTEFKHYHGGVEGMAKMLTHNMCVEEAIENGGGITVKYVGDGVLGCFPDPDAAQKGINAGLDILRRIDAQNKKNGWGYPDPREICTRVGVQFGPVWMFEFKQSDRLDPQGPPVDLAARLCSIAGEMQVVVTEDTFVAGGGDGTFPNHSDVEERNVQGIRERQRLLTVASNRASVKPIPSPGHVPPLDTESQEKLDHAAQPWVSDRDFEKSIERYGLLLEQDSRNFEAAYRFAELLVMHFRGNPAEERTRLAKARKTLCDAKHVRPQCCYVWKLLSWIRYREFLLSTDDKVSLGEAVEYAETALAKAELNMDEFGSAVAKIYLIIYLNKRIEYSYGDVDRDLALAQQYVSEVQEIFDQSGWLQSNFHVGQALTLIAVGNPEEADSLLKKALIACPNNRLVFEAKQRLTSWS